MDTHCLLRTTTALPVEFLSQVSFHVASTAPPFSVYTTKLWTLIDFVSRCTWLNPSVLNSIHGNYEKTVNRNNDKGCNEMSLEWLSNSSFYSILVWGSFHMNINLKAPTRSHKIILNSFKKDPLSNTGLLVDLTCHKRDPPIVSLGLKWIQHIDLSLFGPRKHFHHALERGGGEASWSVRSGSYTIHITLYNARIISSSITLPQYLKMFQT
jgi:hypothetical protein